jgi:transcriptional regulator with XRE-family HTH domain
MRYNFRKLKAAREQRLMTRTELAELTGLSLATVSMVEKGKAPWKKAIRAIAKELKVTDVVLPERSERKSA